MRRASQLAAMALGGSLIVAASGCASLPPCPARGGPPWSELTSPHFVVRTDLAERDAEELTRQLEEARATMLAMSWRHESDPVGRVVVIAFRSERELAAVVPFGVGGMLVKHPPFSPTLLLGGTSPIDEVSAVSHEVAHDLALRFVPFEPPWYAEGVATFFEALSYDRVSGRARVGVPPKARVFGAGRGWSSEAVIRAHSLPDSAPGTFENRAWVVFHYLFFHHGAELARFADLLRQLTPWDKAWNEAFSGLSFAQLDDELAEYLVHGRFETATSQLTIVVGRIDKRPLRDGEVHSLRAFLFSMTPQLRPRVPTELTESLADEPPSAESLATAYYLASSSAKETRLSFARRAAAASPSRWLAAVAYEDAVGVADPLGRRGLFAALAVSPQQPELLKRLAQVEASEGNWVQALAFAERTIHLGESRDIALLGVYTQALAHVGRCPEAALAHQIVAGAASPRNAELLAFLRREVDGICAGVAP